MVGLGAGVELHAYKCVNIVMQIQLMKQWNIDGAVNRFSTQQNGMTNSFFYKFGVYRVLEKSSSYVDCTKQLLFLYVITQ